MKTGHDNTHRGICIYLFLHVLTLLTLLWTTVTPMMELKPNAGSDRAWVWNTLADYADECPKPELLAIRFLNAESKSLQPVFNLDYIVISVYYSFFFFSICQCCMFKQPLCSSYMWWCWCEYVLIFFVLFTDAQKFKVKFDESKEAVRKNLEGTGTYYFQSFQLLLSNWVDW